MNDGHVYLSCCFSLHYINELSSDHPQHNLTTFFFNSAVFSNCNWKLQIRFN